METSERRVAWHGVDTPPVCISKNTQKLEYHLITFCPTLSRLLRLHPYALTPLQGVLFLNSKSFPSATFLPEWKEVSVLHANCRLYEVFRPPRDVRKLPGVNSARSNYYAHLCVPTGQPLRKLYTEHASAREICYRVSLSGLPLPYRLRAVDILHQRKTAICPIIYLFICLFIYHMNRSGRFELQLPT